MKKVFIISVVLGTSILLRGQSAPATQKSTAQGEDKATAAAATLSPADLAKATLAAHGGDKLKQMKSIVTKGGVDVNAFGQAMAGAFSTAISGTKYFFELSTAAQQLKQVSDGKQTYCTFPGFELPPLNTLGLPLLARIGDEGYIVSSLTDKKKKGFRVTSPEGFYTDFFVDEKTRQIKGYESAYELGGRRVTTAVEIDEFLQVDGISAPKKYSQRFDLGQMTLYANFKAKTILVNSEIADDAFAMPK